MPSSSTIRRNAGQRLFVGFEGTSPSADFQRFCQEVRPAGVVLFARNVVDPAQVFDLNRQLSSLIGSEYPVFLAVDQEGGPVQRIKATRWPAMRAVGDADDLALTRQVVGAINRELRAMGFDLNFAPVADVDSNPNNPIIGRRSFSRDPAKVAAQVQAAVWAMRDEHIVSTAKHWPGHGDTSEDSHLALPSVNRSQAQVEAVELPPFTAAIRAGVDTVMTAHVVFPQIDPDTPATLSDKLINGWLRRDRGFNGVVFSDDLTMKAMRDHFTLSDQLSRGSRAGVDVFLVCADADLQAAAFEELVRLQTDDPAQEAYAAGAFQRVMALRQRAFINRPPPPSLDVVGSAEHQALAARFAGLA